MVVVAGIARGVAVNMLDRANTRFGFVVMIDDVGVCWIWILGIDGSGWKNIGWVRSGSYSIWDW
jgi:hypothetical protein